MSGEKNKKGGRYEAFVAAIEADGPLEVSVLASARSLRAPASAQATRAARQIVGAIPNEKGRVGRVAALLDELVDADSETASPKRRHAS